MVASITEPKCLWINNEVWVEVIEIDPEGSQSINHDPTQNELIFPVLPQQFYQQKTFIMMRNVCFCLKGECFSKLSTIFVVLIAWHKLDPTVQLASRKNVLLGLLPCSSVIPWDYALAVPRLLPLPWQGISHPKWTWKAINMHKYGFIFNK